MNCILLAVSGLALAIPAQAANIYVLSSTNSITDDAAVAALTSRGHTVTLGVPFASFDGTVDLGAYQTVYLQCNVNWVSPDPMPAAGQQQLINWVNAGGRLVTSEWTTYYAYEFGHFEFLEPIMPGETVFEYGNVGSTTYTQYTPDPAMNAGLPMSFSFILNSFSGTESFTSAKPAATTYYTTSNNPGVAGLIGWSVGSGRVFSFTSTCGQDQVADPVFGRLFANVMGPVTPGGCYANCDGSTAAPALTANDFQCFINKFAGNDPYANCDGSTAIPSLTANDFQCFINKYAGGCR